MYGVGTVLERVDGDRASVLFDNGARWEVVETFLEELQDQTRPPDQDLDQVLAAQGWAGSVEDDKDSPSFDPPASNDRTPEFDTVLEFHTIAELRERVAARGPRGWLLRGIWPHGDYGVHAGEAKSQKTWTTADLAISVASGTPWLGHVDVDTPGPVVMFVGEGGEGNTLRRLDAIADGRDVNLDHLPIIVCTRAPHLNDARHLQAMADQVAGVSPALVTLDPLYLAARGAELGDLYKMGALLEQPQRICQWYGCSLWVVHHYNRQAGTGARRIAGAGPAEWGRVLITADMKSKSLDHEGGTRVVTELEILGGEVADQKLRVVRHIKADHDGLDSALRVDTVTTRVDDDPGHADGSSDRLKPAERRTLAALRGLGRPATIQQLGDWLADNDPPPLKRETFQRCLTRLAALDLVDALEEAPGAAKQWFVRMGV
jgi:hypothetical protein